jgi:hypothetical protein
MAFEDFLDAKRVLGVLGKRFARYGLSLHLPPLMIRAFGAHCHYRTHALQQSKTLRGR